MEFGTDLPNTVFLLQVASMDVPFEFRDFIRARLRSVAYGFAQPHCSFSIHRLFIFSTICSNYSSKHTAMDLSPHTCSSCHQLFQTLDNLTNLVSEEGYQHHNLKSLITSAAQGCPLCTIIWKTIEIHWDEGEDQTLFLKAELEYQNDEEEGNAVGVDPNHFRLAANGARIQLFLKSGDDWNRLTTITF